MILNMVGCTGRNFTVTGGTTEPVAAMENTLWVETEAAIPGWILSPLEPETAEEGTVWISTGSQGDIRFNALRMQELWIIPQGCRQYLSGVWTDKTLRLRSGETWQVITESGE